MKIKNAMSTGIVIRGTKLRKFSEQHQWEHAYYELLNNKFVLTDMHAVEATITSPEAGAMLEWIKHEIGKIDTSDMKSVSPILRSIMAWSLLASERQYEKDITSHINPAGESQIGGEHALATNSSDEGNIALHRGHATHPLETMSNAEVVQTPEKSNSVAILKVGTDGGDITLAGEQALGRWHFWIESADGDILSENSHLNRTKSDYFHTLEAAFAALDKYPWPYLYPVFVHPEFEDDVMNALQSRLGAGESSEMQRWTHR